MSNIYGTRDYAEQLVKCIDAITILRLSEGREAKLRIYADDCEVSLLIMSEEIESKVMCLLDDIYEEARKFV